MSHISIFFETIALVIGSAALLYIYQYYQKYRLEFIKMYFIKIFIFNLIIIESILIQYAMKNIYIGGIVEKPFLLLTINIVITFSVIALLYYRLKVSLFIRDKLIPRFFKGIFIILIVFTCVMILKEIFFPSHTGPVENLYVNGSEYGTRIIAHYVIRIEYFLVFIIFGELIINPGFKNNPNKRRAIIIFGLFHFFISFLMLNIYLRPLPDYSVISSIHEISVNLIALIWFRFFFDKYYIDSMIITGHQKSIELICNKYNITQRESEIFSLILQGKSNKEIMSILDLSLNTVRNHIYNLYQKLGINSRTQLFKLVLEYGEKDRLENLEK